MFSRVLPYTDIFLRIHPKTTRFTRASSISNGKGGSFSDSYIYSVRDLVRLSQCKAGPIKTTEVKPECCRGTTASPANASASNWLSGFCRGHFALVYSWDLHPNGFPKTRRGVGHPNSKDKRHPSIHPFIHPVTWLKTNGTILG